jgi:hypothetical protein
LVARLVRTQINQIFAKNFFLFSTLSSIKCRRQIVVMKSTTQLGIRPPHAPRDFIEQFIKLLHRQRDGLVVIAKESNGALCYQRIKDFCIPPP